MAKKKRKKMSSKKRKAAKSRAKGQVPLGILEDRFQKLGRLIGRRGGDNVLD